MKACKKCKQTKLFTEFTKNRLCKDGYFSFCKECVKSSEYDKLQGKFLTMKDLNEWQNASTAH